MFEIIIYDIVQYLQKYAFKACVFAVLFFFLALFICSIYGYKHKKKKDFYWTVFLKSIIVAYLIFYIYIVVGITLLSREGKYISVINIRLFSTFDPMRTNPKYIYENIIMFIPYAIILYMLATPFRKIFISILVGSVSSLIIEMMQMFTKLGSFVLDDILTNTIGMFTGFLLCKLVVWLSKIFCFSWNRRK